jgi:putative membrane protein
MNAILMRGAFAAIGFWVATYFIGGLRFDNATTLILAGVALGLINAFVRPLFILLTLPITVVTLGLFLLVINAAMVGLVAWLLPGMRLEGFWAALATSLVVSVVSWIGGALARA